MFVCVFVEKPLLIYKVSALPFLPFTVLHRGAGSYMLGKIGGGNSSSQLDSQRFKEHSNGNKGHFNYKLKIRYIQQCVRNVLVIYTIHAIIC